jgi:hypothetical protein
MRRHKWDMSIQQLDAWVAWLADRNDRRRFPATRNWPCGACGLWRRAKVHRR